MKDFIVINNVLLWRVGIIAVVIFGAAFLAVRIFDDKIKNDIYTIILRLTTFLTLTLSIFSCAAVQLTVQQAKDHNYKLIKEFVRYADIADYKLNDDLLILKKVDNGWDYSMTITQCLPDISIVDTNDNKITIECIDENQDVIIHVPDYDLAYN